MHSWYLTTKYHFLWHIWNTCKCTSTYIFIVGQVLCRAFCLSFQKYYKKMTNCLCISVKYYVKRKILIAFHNHIWSETSVFRNISRTPLLIHNPGDIRTRSHCTRLIFFDNDINVLKVVYISPVHRVRVLQSTR